MANSDPRKNSEGYPDPTAYEAIRQADALQQEVNRLIGVLKYIIDKSGFELLNRIEIRDKRTGGVFR